MGVLIMTLNLLGMHLTQPLFVHETLAWVSYSSGYMQQIGTFCRSQTRQTLTTLLVLYLISPSTKKRDVLIT